MLTDQARDILSAPTIVHVAIVDPDGRPHASAVWADVDEAEATAWLQSHEATALIHGHTHRPQRHHEPSGERWVLSDWDFDQAQPSARRGSFLKLENGALTVEQVTA